MTEKILIFPGGMPRSLDFLERCKLEGRVVVGASSIKHDPSRGQYPEWEFLPFITDENFESALALVLAHHKITSIYSPNLVAWDFLSENLGRIYPAAKLINESPVDAELLAYRNAGARVAADARSPLFLAFDGLPKDRPPTNDLVGIFRAVDLVPGMCDHDKMFALVEALRNAPTGDIVEIGTWWGKSAALLLLLGRRYAIGPLLCVDPWSQEDLLQAGASNLVDNTARKISAATAFDIFEMNLLPLAAGDVNYLRLPSVDAAKVYGHSTIVSSTTFGETRFTGQVSVLHIDGNHDEEVVQADIASWGRFVRPGGVIVFDDYVWPYGTGPKCVADRFLIENSSRVQAAFVMGSALFVQLKGG